MRLDKLKLLLNIEKRRFLNSNSNRKKLFTGITALIILGFFISIYVVSITVFLYNSYRQILITTFAIIGFIGIFVSTLRSGYSNLFGKSEYNIIFPLPFTDLEIILSKLAGIYLSSYYYVLIMLSFPVLYVLFKAYGIIATINGLLSLVFFPAIPVSLALLIASLGSKNFKFKYARQFFSILLTLLIVLLYALIYVFRKLFYDNLYLAAVNVSRVFTTVLFPYKFFENAVIKNSIIETLLFSVISIAVAAIVSIYISKNYFKIHYKNNNTAKYKKSKTLDFKKSSLSKTLFKKELRTYFSSSIYLMNTIFAPMFLTIIGIISIFLDDNSLNSLSGYKNLGEIVRLNIIFILCSFAAISQTTYCSMSIEGKNIWITLSLPIENKKIFISKIKVGMSIIIFPIIFCAIVFGIKYKLSVFDIVMFILTPISYSLFGNILGLLYDIKTANYSWNNENEIVKQRFSMILIQIILAIPLLITYFVSRKFNLNSSIMIFIVISIINTLLLIKLTKKKLYMD
ncbi:hypothetical protein [Peptoniphilus mikwangii]|uniref:hypothetical protein n=1 Tax=Peptoniphilus mikwangii TaxID=1354300 RepID=UPI0004150714|nr:hypothetical protein [Peptoniphilus mikwangii]